MIVGNSAVLPSHVLDGEAFPGHYDQTFMYHSLPSALSPSRITHLEFDSYASSGKLSSMPKSHNSILGLIKADHTNPNFGVLWAAYTGGQWYFAADILNGDIASQFYVTGGFDTPVHMGIVVDGFSKTVYGTYDFGSGVHVTPSYSVTAAQIASLTDVGMEEDTRVWPSHGGAQFDNINVTTSGTPEPSTTAMLLAGAIAGIGLLRRIRRA